MSGFEERHQFGEFAESGRSRILKVGGQWPERPSSRPLPKISAHMGKKMKTQPPWLWRDHEASCDHKQVPFRSFHPFAHMSQDFMTHSF
jgi:hypothetical protein